MNKYIKKTIILLSVIVLISIVVISMFCIIKKFKNKEKINNVIENYNENNIQEKLENIENNKNVIEDDLTLQMDGEVVVRSY